MKRALRNLGIIIDISLVVGVGALAAWAIAKQAGMI